MKPRPHHNTALLTAIARVLRAHAQGLLTETQLYHAICAAYLAHAH